MLLTCGKPLTTSPHRLHRGVGSLAPNRVSSATKLFGFPLVADEITCTHRLNRQGLIARAKDGEEPDWNEEMTIFQKRISRPNQLATLRELAGKTHVGKVLFCKENLAIISGLDSDAPVGTKISFVTGGTGVLLWHRSNNLAFAIILGGASMISVGEGAECKITGVLQVVDPVKGPATKKEYEILQVPAGDALFGKVVNFFGQEQQLGLHAHSTAGRPVKAPLGFDRVRPLISAQVDMAGREQITECLLTGVKALDILTPLGRGMNMLVVGPTGSGKSSLGLDAILAQSSTGVRCVYASMGRTDEELMNVVRVLEEGKALGHTAVLSSPAGSTTGEQLAAICAACSVGERIRDEGGHALVVLDTVKPLVDAWEAFIAGLANLGRNKVLEGLIKDSEGRDISIASSESDEELVDYQGMLVSGAIAQRRGFFSTLFMRPAKLNRNAGGGSMTLIPLVSGKCATGVSKRVDMTRYQTLSDDQKAKIQAVLEKKLEEELQAAVAPGDMVTEVVEEFISIADGQVVLSERSPSGSYVVDPKLSITRIGTRAYHKAVENLAPQIRLDLTQAEDARKFSLLPDDPLIRKADGYTRRIQAALLQERCQPAPLEEQVVMLLAIQKGFTDSVPPEAVSAFLKGATKCVSAAAFEALQEISSTKILTAAAEKKILDALTSYSKMREVIV